MANFKKMLEWLRKNKKVRRPSWNQTSYLYLSKERILNNFDEKVKFDNINSLEADDYEIYKEVAPIMTHEECMTCHMLDVWLNGKKVVDAKTKYCKCYPSTLTSTDANNFAKVIKEQDPKALARLFHDFYEEHSKKEGWETQESCRVSFDSLPENNKQVMIKTAEDIIKTYNKEIEDSDRKKSA